MHALAGEEACFIGGLAGGMYVGSSCIVVWCCLGGFISYERARDNQGGRENRTLT